MDREYVIVFAQERRGGAYSFQGVFLFNRDRSTTAQWLHDLVSPTITFDGRGAFDFERIPRRMEQDDQQAEAAQVDPDLVRMLERNMECGNFSVDDQDGTARVRGSAQKAFADRVKSNYGWKCAITGISTRAFLVASHIVPWSEDIRIRTDPSNGICLSTFADRAFDTGFLEITPSGRTQVRWDNVDDDGALRAEFQRIDNIELYVPTFGAPDPAKLAQRIDLGY